jgi:hypothetical protein
MRDVKLTFLCEGCETTIAFPASEAGMIRECPECGGRVDVPEAIRRDPSESQQTLGGLQEELNRRYFEENVRQQGEMARQIEVADRHQEWSRKNLQRESDLLGRREELLERETRLVDRFERIAESFESYLSKWAQDA